MAQRRLRMPLPTGASSARTGTRCERWGFTSSRTDQAGAASARTSCQTIARAACAAGC
jgi:hypothetical protein